MGRIVVMIVDSNPFSRSGLRQTLSQKDGQGILEIMECDPGEEGKGALTKIAEVSPDVVLVDVDYPALGGLELGRKIIQSFPGTVVVMLSANPHDSEDELFEVIKTGAVAYLRSRHCSVRQLIETIKQVSNGEYPINDSVSSRPDVARRVLVQFQDAASMRKPTNVMTAPLTRKELQVLIQIADGSSNKQIANILGISQQTAKNHVSAILRKIKANHRAHAVFIAMRDGLIPIQSCQDAGHGDIDPSQKPIYSRN